MSSNASADAVRRIRKPGVVPGEVWDQVFPLVSGTFDHRATQQGVNMLVPYCRDPECAQLVAWLKATVAAKFHNDTLQLPLGEAPPGCTERGLVKMCFQILVLDRGKKMYVVIAAGVASPLQEGQVVPGPDGMRFQLRAAR